MEPHIDRIATLLAEGKETSTFISSVVVVFYIMVHMPVMKFIINCLLLQEKYHWNQNVSIIKRKLKFFSKLIILYVRIA